jgi:hypothetical protein
MEITTNIQNGVELQLQSQVFQAWFNENLVPKITFADGKNGTVQTCTTFDEFGRPSEWHFTECVVKAEYFTVTDIPELAENINYRSNYNFNKFIIYGTI